MSAAESPKHIQVETVEGVAVVSLTNAEILFEQEVIQEVGDELYGLVDQQGCTRLLLDLGNVKYMASSMLGKMIGLKRKIEQAGGRLRLCNVGPLLRDALSVAQLDRILEIHDSREAALKKF